ncbi:MAG: hypothetical protein NDJ94_13525 [Vicinamibacteria bacterium]|jgi:hypothetical protein|nr:hypothetical protein [Vicinamibacteria bacterium]
MGRIVELLTAVAEEAEEGGEGLVLGIEASQRLMEQEWTEEDLEDALGLVHDTLLQGELVESADSLSARLVEILGAPLTDEAYAAAEKDGLRLSLDAIAQIVRRVNHLEEVLGLYRDGGGPDREGFDALRARLMNRGIEKEMEES